MTAENVQDDAVEVGIPKSLYSQIEEHLPETTYASVQDLAVNLFRVLVRETRSPSEGGDSDDEETIRKRLELLGYL
jgi:hypothetical protein